MEQQKLAYKKPYQGEDIEDLLLALCYGDQFPTEYQEALIEFHTRYMPFINSACNQACKFFSNSQELATDLAHNVFLIACQQAIQFDAGKGLSPVEIDRKFKEWLVKIAKAELKRFTSNNPDRKVLISMDDINLGEEGETGPEQGYITGEESNYPITPESVAQILQSLKPRDRDIVMVYLTHVHRKNAHLPDDIMEEICAKYGTTSMNVRKIKQRVFDKIKQLKGDKS